MPMGSRPQKENFPISKKTLQQHGKLQGQMKDPHMAGFWSAILPGTVASSALLSVSLWSQLFQLAFKAHFIYCPRHLHLGQ